MEHLKDYEKETLRVLKMQEGDLNKLEEQTQIHTENLQHMDSRLSELKARAKELAQSKGVDIPEERHYPTPTVAPEKAKMSIDDIPDWAALSERAEKDVIGRDIEIKDLLTGDEIKYSIDQVERIHKEFEMRTGLNKRDLNFLSVAIAIQTARWALIPKIATQLESKGKLIATLSPSAVAMLESHPDTTQLAVINEANNEIIEDVQAEEISAEPRSWEDILKEKDNNPEKHFNNDAMNWLFGIVNSITGTKTEANLSSTDNITGESVSTTKVLAEAMRHIKEDPRRLTAAVYAQYVKDRASKGESTDPLEPITKTLQPATMTPLFQSQAEQLASLSSLTFIGKQAAFPLIVNMAIGALHSLNYNPAIDGPREFYEARTRKILLLSNILATGANVSFTTATEQWMKLDIVGILVSGARTIQDVAYMTNLEDHFINSQLDSTLAKEIEDIDRHFETTKDIQIKQQ